MSSELTANELAIIFKDAFQTFQEVMETRFDRLEKEVGGVKAQLGKLIEILEANNVVSSYEASQIYNHSRK